MLVEQTFGERLRIIRNERGWTQQDLAAISGVRLRTIQSYEENQRLSPRLDNAEKIAKALGMDVLELLRGSTPGSARKN